LITSEKLYVILKTPERQGQMDWKACAPFQDQDFADLFSQHWQPGPPPFRLAPAPVLQFIEGLSERGAADAVRGGIDWK
jgi:hypothetical protein